MFNLWFLIISLLTRGSCCVIRPMFCPFLPMMKRCSQAGAVTSTTITLFACTGDKRLTSSNLIKIHNLTEISFSQTDTPIKRENPS